MDFPEYGLPACGGTRVSAESGQFSRWGGGSGGMDRRSLPERGASTAETPERKGRGAGLPDPHPFWLGNAAWVSPQAVTPRSLWIK